MGTIFHASVCLRVLKVSCLHCHELALVFPKLKKTQMNKLSKKEWRFVEIMSVLVAVTAFSFWIFQSMPEKAISLSIFVVERRMLLISLSGAMTMVLLLEAVFGLYYEIEPRRFWGYLFVTSGFAIAMAGANTPTYWLAGLLVVCGVIVIVKMALRRRINKIDRQIH